MHIRTYVRFYTAANSPQIQPKKLQIQIQIQIQIQLEANLDAAG